jgi:murein DD-endopeptidase MepM/ murein hydrolase activator NlpD
MTAMLAGLPKPAGAGTRAVSPAWPLDAPQVLSSSFGEYRANHLHAGIDLGTGGRTGIPCRAVGDGYVVRMRMSPFGYGKALYIQLEGGTLTVYGHLACFAEPLAARARSEQKRLQRYTFDLQIPPGELRVGRGEIVAWSGQTGVGEPHLHYEMRHGDVAINPQTAGFPVVDSIPPVIEEIAATPLDFRSHVDGQWATHPVPLENDAAPLRVGGRIGFSMRAWDAATNRSYRVGPYRYELRIDGIPVFRSTQERFDYADNHLAVLEYDQERLIGKGERVQLLFLRPGDRLPGREAPHSREGVLFDPGGRDTTGERSFAPGPHTLEVEVADAAGNTTVRRVRVSAGLPFAAERWPAAQDDFVGPDHPVLRLASPPVWRSRFVELDIDTDRPLEVYATMPEIPAAEFFVERIGSLRYRVAVGIAWSQGRIDLGAMPILPELQVPLAARGLTARAAARVADLDPAVTVEVPKGALLEDVALRIERVSARRLEPSAELFPAGPCVLVEPRTAALDVPVGIALSDSGVARRDRVGLFWVNRGGDLRLLSTTRDGKGDLRGEAAFLSYFGAFADTTPPRIGALRVVLRARRPQRLEFTVRDDGARLGEDGIVATLDGAFAIPEWDPETGSVIVEPEAKLGRGPHRLKVVATDQLGNRATREMRFQVP